MEWVNSIKAEMPDYAKDIKLNLDTTIKRSVLGETAEYVALAAAFATGHHKLWTWIHSEMADSQEANAAITAASLMAMNNTWYPYVEMTKDIQLKNLPAQLRMNAISTHAGTTKEKFEAYSLAASIVGKCEFCVKAHYDTLRKAGYSAEQLRDIGRISAVVVAVSKIMV
jgi:lipoyl-dependent peroxiredoxin subunit D